jgi:hypothetical protein
MESQTKIITLQRHIMEQQALHRRSRANSRGFWDLVLAFKMISRESTAPASRRSSAWRERERTSR